MIACGCKGECNRCKYNTNCSGDLNDMSDTVAIFHLQGIFKKLSCSRVFLASPRSHPVTGCLLAVIIFHSTATRLWQSTNVSFHLPKRDQLLQGGMKSLEGMAFEVVSTEGG